MPDFDSLVNAHSAEIFKYLWRLMRETADAEDCLQETFLRAYRAYGRLDPQANCRAWLYKIATNVARTHGKRRAQHIARASALDPDAPHAGPTLSEQIEQQELMRRVARAVEQLPHHQRAALLMRKYQDLDYAAIAEALQCSEEAARANVYQALKKLRALLPAWSAEEMELP